MSRISITSQICLFLMLAACAGEAQDSQTSTEVMISTEKKVTPPPNQQSNAKTDITHRKPAVRSNAKGSTYISRAFKKGVSIADMQRMKQLVTLALQYQLTQGRWPESQADFIRTYPDTELLFKGNQKSGVKRTMDLIYQPPINLSTISSEPIIFIADEKGTPDLNATQGFTDGSVKQP